MLLPSRYYLKPGQKQEFPTGIYTFCLNFSFHIMATFLIFFFDENSELFLDKVLQSFDTSSIFGLEN